LTSIYSTLNLTLIFGRLLYCFSLGKWLIRQVAPNTKNQPPEPTRSSARRASARHTQSPQEQRAQNRKLKKWVKHPTCNHGAKLSSVHFYTRAQRRQRPKAKGKEERARTPRAEGKEIRGVEGIRLIGRLSGFFRWRFEVCEEDGSSEIHGEDQQLRHGL
jgi:hypothetical protein